VTKGLDLPDNWEKEPHQQDKHIDSIDMGKHENVVELACVGVDVSEDADKNPEFFGLPESGQSERVLIPLS